MRLLKTHSHTSGRLHEERQVKENAGAMIRGTAVKNLPRTASMTGEGQDEERRLKENTGAVTRGTNVKNLPRNASVAGGARRRNAETNTKKKYDASYSPARGGGKCLAENT